MAKNPQLVIDIGQNRIKVLEVAPSGKSGVKVVKCGSESLALDPKAEQAEIYQRIQDTLPLLLQQLGIKQKRAIISLPGRAAFTRRLQVPVVRGRQLNRIIRYEARQHVPFPLEEINMDYEVGKKGDDATELDINLVAVRKEIADGYVRVLKKCGIRTDLIEAAPLSIYNAYAATPHRDPEEVTAVVSIGSSSTDIVVEQNGKMQFMRSAPVAGAFLTELLVKKLNITSEKAEEFKCKQAEQYTGAEEISAEDVASVLEGGFERIVTEIQRSFDFYVSQPDAMPVTRVFVCGGTVNMDGVSEFLEDRLGVPVQVLDTNEIAGIELGSDPNALKNEAALAGMAVRAGGLASCALSFAPASVKQRLELERRAPMLSLMGVVLVLMLAGSIFTLNSWVEKQAQAVEQMRQIISPGDLANPELKKQREIQDKYNNRYSRIFQVASKRGVLSRIYLEVQEMIPQDIWLDSIDVKSDRLTIEGRALSDLKISTYIQNLSLSPFFDNETVILENAVYSSDTSGGASQVDFTIQIVAFNDPTPEEIKFIEEFRTRMQDSTIVAIRTIRPENAGPESDASLLIGLYQTEFSDEKSRLALYNKIDSALNAAKFEIVKSIELRLHGGQNDERERMIIARDKLANFGEGSLGPEEFKQTFTMVTPSPSPTPSPTPTPDLEDGDSSGGFYGGMMYGGMMGMGMGMGGMGMGGQ